MNIQSKDSRQILPALAMVSVAALLCISPSANAQDDPNKAACGRKAKEAEIVGKEKISAFVAECVDSMKEAARIEEDAKKAEREKKREETKAERDKKSADTKAERDRIREEKQAERERIREEKQAEREKKRELKKAQREQKRAERDKKREEKKNKE